MATKADKTIPNLENATPAFLLDEIAKMRVEAARLKFLDGVYKQALEARATEPQLQAGALIEGEGFTGWWEPKTQERVDPDAVREFFKDDPVNLAKMIKVISFKQLTTKPKEFPTAPIQKITPTSQEPPS